MAARIRFRFTGGLIQTAAALGRTYNGPYGGDGSAAEQTALSNHSALRKRPLRGTDAQCAPLRRNRGSVRMMQAFWRCGLTLPPAGDFSRGEEFPKRAGGCGPRTPLGCAACIPRRDISQAVTLHRAIPSHTAHPFPASRGPVESGNRCGYGGFHEGRTNCPGTRAQSCTRQLLRAISPTSP